MDEVMRKGRGESNEGKARRKQDTRRVLREEEGREGRKQEVEKEGEIKKRIIRGGKSDQD